MDFAVIIGTAGRELTARMWGPAVPMRQAKGTKRSRPVTLWDYPRSIYLELFVIRAIVEMEICDSLDL